DGKSAGPGGSTGVGAGCGGVGGLLTALFSTFLGALFGTFLAAVFAFDQPTIDQGLLGVGAPESDSLEGGDRRQLLRRQRSSETGHAASDPLPGVAIGAVTPSLEARRAELHPLDVVDASREGGQHTVQGRADAAATLRTVATGAAGIDLLAHGDEVGAAPCRAAAFEGGAVAVDRLAGHPVGGEGGPGAAFGGSRADGEIDQPEGRDEEEQGTQPVG